MVSFRIQPLPPGESSTIGNYCQLWKWTSCRPLPSCDFRKGRWPASDAHGHGDFDRLYDASGFASGFPASAGIDVVIDRRGERRGKNSRKCNRIDGEPNAFSGRARECQYPLPLTTPPADHPVRPVRQLCVTFGRFFVTRNSVSTDHNLAPLHHRAFLTQ